MCTVPAQRLGLLWLVFQHKWGVPGVAGPELCPHGLCWSTGSTELGAVVPAAVHRQARDFSSISKSGPPGGNKTTRSAVTCGNAHPSSWSSPSSLSCASPAPRGTPAQGWECALPGAASTDRWGTAPLCSEQTIPGGTETCPVLAGKRSCHGSTAATSLPIPRPSHSWFLENQLPDSPRNWILPSAALQTNPGMIIGKQPVPLWCRFALFFLHVAASHHGLAVAAGCIAHSPSD